MSNSLISAENIYSSYSCSAFHCGLNAQEPEKVLTSVFDEALTDRTAYNNLEYLCKNTKGRIAGSPAAEKAVEFTRQALINAGADTVWLQKVPVPHWERGFEKCTVIIVSIQERKIFLLQLLVFLLAHLKKE